jgi:hypothetical protein
MSKTTNSIATIDRFVQAVRSGGVKYAAEANTEPGSVGGATTHPVKDVDDSTEDAEEGSRSAENTADVKADQGTASVDSTPENISAKKAAAKRAVDGKSEDGSINPNGTAAEDQLQIGTKKQPTGEDPAVETSSAKAEKEDATGGRLGNTTHPARTNNSELDGYKYASMSIEKLAAMTSDLGNQLLAAIANMQKSAALTDAQKKIDVNGNGKIEGSDLAALRSGQSEDDEKSAVDAAAQAGWELAGSLSGNFDKQAADALVTSTLESVIKTAADDADKVAAFLNEFNSELTKKAMGDMPAGVDPAALAGAGAGAGPDMAAPVPGDAGGGAPDIEQLLQLLEQLGISPEDLEAAMAAEGGGGAGGPAGAPPAAADAAGADSAGGAPGMEVEAQAKHAAVTKKGATTKQVRDYIQEVLSRSRS